VADEPDSSRSLPPQLRASLCAGCRFSRLIESGRGSWFLLCGRAQQEPWFAKYPPQPLRACLGFEPKAGS
jgi:hypothetical protein